MASPVVSVLLPVRNARGTIDRAVASILGQSLRELELVVVDDGSTDGSTERLGGEPRLRVIRTEPRGLVPALQAGLSACRGRYLARMDADDEALPNRLAASIDALEADPSLAGVGTQVEIVRADRPVSPNMQAYGRWLNSLTTVEALARDRFIESPLCHPSVTLRREALEAVGGWEAGDFAEDYQLWLKLIASGHRLRCLPEVLLRWTDREDRLTRTDSRYSHARQIALKARFLAEGPLRASRRCAIWGAGETGRALARALRGNGVEITRFIDVDPRKIGQRIQGAEVISPERLAGPEEHLVAAVSAKGARDEIRAFLTARAWRETEHFTCAA